MNIENMRQNLEVVATNPIYKDGLKTYISIVCDCDNCEEKSLENPNCKMFEVLNDGMKTLMIERLLGGKTELKISEIFKDNFYVEFYEVFKELFDFLDDMYKNENKLLPIE